MAILVNCNLRLGNITSYRGPDKYIYKFTYKIATTNQPDYPDNNYDLVIATINENNFTLKYLDSIGNNFTLLS